MTSEALEDLSHRIGTNTLTAAQQAALGEALATILPVFPSSVATGAVGPDESMARQWMAALYTIAAEGAASGGPVTGTGTLVAASASALSAVDVGAMPQGMPAAVATFGAAFSLQPAGGRVADGVTLLASSDPGQLWERGATLVGPSAALQAFWYLDPAAGDDEATGLDVGDALASFAEIVRRYGTRSPRLTQVTTFTWLSDGGADDPVCFAPVVDGNGGVVMTSTPTTLHAAALAAHTPSNFAAGTLPTITVAAQAWTPGTLVRDSTAGATFYVEADLGAGVAQISEPSAFPITFLPSPRAIAPGDAIALLAPRTIFVNALSFSGVGNGSSGGGFLVTGINLTAELIGLIGPGIVLAECRLTGAEFETIEGRTGSFPVFSSCYGDELGGVGVMSGRMNWNAGTLAGRGHDLAAGSSLDFDVHMLLRGHYEGAILIGAAYFGQWFTNTGGPEGFGQIAVEAINAGAVRVWGPAQIEVNTGQQIALRGVTAAGALLVTGGILIDQASTAFPWSAAAHSWGAAVSITPAAIDTAQGLSNPQTGSSIHF
jgi:hypothetical protein